jgi:hypothetical protein
MDVGTLPPLLLGGGLQNVPTNAAGVYDFGDRDGDGLRNEGLSDRVDPPGLDMTNRYIRHNIASSGQTEPTKSINLDLNGGNLSATTGYVSTAAYRYTGLIQIRNVGSVAMNDGHLETKDLASGYSGSTGNILIGEETNRAGSVQIARIMTYTLDGPTAGSVAIHGTGDVLIKDTKNTVDPGDDAAGDVDVTVRGQGRAGDVAVHHHGSFLARDILATHVCNGDTYQGQLVFNGAVTGAPSGTFTAARIVTTAYDYIGSTHQRDGRGGHVSISNYVSVLLGDVDTSFEDWPAAGAAGNVLITNITGNVTITGSITLNDLHDSTAPIEDGDLAIYAGGIITVKDLDLDKIGAARFDAGSRSIRILGTITNFTGANDLSLMAPAGQTLHYFPDINPALDWGKFQLRDLAGTTNAGGMLLPVAKGTVVWFK